MRLKSMVLMMSVILFLFACGTVPSTMYISYSFKSPEHFSSHFYPSTVSTQENYLNFDRGKLIVDGAEYREISFSGGIKEIKVSYLPEGSYDFYLTFYRGKRAVAWGSVKNVKLEGGVKKHLQMVLNYQEDWE